MPLHVNFMLWLTCNEWPTTTIYIHTYITLIGIFICKLFTSAIGSWHDIDVVGRQQTLRLLDDCCFLVGWLVCKKEAAAKFFIWPRAALFTHTGVSVRVCMCVYCMRLFIYWLCATHPKHCLDIIWNANTPAFSCSFTHFLPPSLPLHFNYVYCSSQQTGMNEKISNSSSSGCP